jgi:hypothetical protein
MRDPVGPVLCQKSALGGLIYEYRGAAWRAKRQVGEHEHVLARHGPDGLIRLTKIGEDPMIR